MTPPVAVSIGDDITGPLDDEDTDMLDSPVGDVDSFVVL